MQCYIIAQMHNKIQKHLVYDTGPRGIRIHLYLTSCIVTQCYIIAQMHMHLVCEAGIRISIHNVTLLHKCTIK